MVDRGSNFIEGGNRFLDAVNDRLQDDNARAGVHQLLQEGVPLNTVVSHLGLDDELTPEVRTFLDTASPELTEGLRQATIGMIRRGDRELPIQFTGEGYRKLQGEEVIVDVSEIGGTTTITVSVGEAEIVVDEATADAIWSASDISDAESRDSFGQREAGGESKLE